MPDYHIPTVVHQTIPVAFMAPLERWLLQNIFESEADGADLYFFASEAPASSLPYPEEADLISGSRHLCPGICDAVQAQLDNRTGEIDLDEANLHWMKIMQGIIKRHEKELPYVTAESSFTCSKMRPDGFGGMAYVITATDGDMIATGDWIHEQLAKRGLVEPEPAKITFKAKPGGCEECVMGSPFYLPCNQPAVHMIQHPSAEGPYRMCEHCADHNVKNRGAKIVGPYLPEAPEAGVPNGEQKAESNTQ